MTTETEVRTVRVGDRAPDFTLKSIGLRDVSLRDFLGQKHVVLLFYPLDWTPG